MVCELKIKQLEKMLNRKLTDKEKRKIREQMHHVEIDDDSEDYEYENKEMEVVA